MKKVDVAVFEAIKSGPGRRVRGRHRQGVRDQERGRRHRQDQHRGSSSTPTGRRGQAAAGRRRDRRARTPSSRTRRWAATPPNTGDHAAELALELRGITKRFGAAHGQRRHRPRAAAWGDPRAAGGERRRQVDADERRLRDGSRPTRARSASTATPVTIGSPRDAMAPGHRHGVPALHADPGHDRGREPRPRRRAAPQRPARPRARARERTRELSEQLRPGRRPRRARRATSRSASSSASRSCARWTAARGSSCSTSRPRC